ncbi:PAS domain-containing protein [Merismopedia glauca]|uniref:histidine kinase n=1 Tax=Merismopedia glauca CCAP 1448/3 TaxID=1296344 RepID=A0A2T1C5C1_9CYAN|nr:PAS domain-containing protein [Merismopedia glauca]PSB03451.1 hypothetical protein C7B64_08555 [Merismopedia glauca CCAP 1448/3]
MSSFSLTEIKLEAAIAPTPPIVTPETTVTEAIALMNAARATRSLSADRYFAQIGASCVLVVQEKHLVGIFTERDVVRLSAQGLPLAEVAIAQVMTQPVMTLRRSEFTDVFSALNLLQTHHLHHLPVVDDSKSDRIMGIVTYESLWQLLRPLEESYKLVESLQEKESRWEAEKLAWLETRNAELGQEIQARTAELETQVTRERLVAAIANRIRSSLNWQEILDTTVTEVRSLLGCDRVAIWQFQPDWSTIAVAESAASNQPSYLGRQVEDTCFTPNRLTYWNERILVVPDIYTTEMSDCHQEFLEQLQIRAKILVPIVQGETVWGMLSAIESQAPRQWQTGETALLQQIATQLAIALQQAAAYQQAEIELAERQQVEAALQFQIELDRLIASISSRFLPCSSENLTHSINQALQEIGEFTQVDTSYIFQYSDTEATHSMTHEWVADGLPPQRQNTQNLPNQVFPWATAILHRGEIVHIPSLANLPVEAAIDRQSLQQFQIESSLIIPLVNQEKVFGFLGFASFHQEHNWTDDNIRLLQIFAEILLNTLQRQQAETELQSSERRYASLAEAVPVGIFRTDAVGNCLYVNDRWSQIAGLSPEEAAGMGWTKGLHPEDRDRVAAEWDRAAIENRPFQQEYRFQRSDKTFSWFFGQAIAEYDVNKQIIGYVGTITDISDRKVAEAALRDNEERLRLALSAANQGLYDLNIQTGEAIVNDEYALMLGYNPAEFQETNGRWIERLHPDDRKPVAAIYQAYINQEIPEYRVEFRQETKTGDWKWILSLGKIIAWDEEGNPLRMLGTHTDISDRKEAELEIQQLNQALEKQNQNLEALVDQRTSELLTFINALPDYIFVVNREEMKIVFCNERLATANFSDRQYVQGKTIFECFPPENAAHFTEKNLQVFESGETLHLQESFALPTGTMYLDTYKIPLKRPNGEVYALIGTSRNITELIEARQNLMARTAQLEATNQELNSFSYSVSHDLRAPLRHMHGFVNALRQRLDANQVLNDQKVAHYLEVIEGSSQKMGELIDGLLTLSRIGRRELVLQPVDLRQLVATAINLAAPNTGTDNPVEFEIGNLPTAIGDPTLLQQVFVNLISNAIKFSRNGSETARIEIKSTPEGIILVKDNGVGFQMEYADQLFGAFQRLHSKQQFPGTGIGLSIVQRIIHRHGGKVWAESKPGAGATFYVQLPS